jgi:Tfp pilus assembly protein PilF
MSRCRIASFALLTCFFATSLGQGYERPWIEVRSPHFRVLSDGSDKDARRVAREFEQMRSVFAVEFPSFRLDSGAPLTVLAPRDENSAKALAPQLWKRKGAKPAGYFQHGWERLYAMVRLDEVTPGAYQVVYHEYVHSFLHMNLRWLPIWLDEGLAEFYGNTRFEQSKIFIGAPSQRVFYLQQKPLIPLETLLAVNSSSPYYHDEDKVEMFYAESWALIHFLVFGPAMQQGQRLNEFYTSLQPGVDQKKAFQQVFGDFKEVGKNLDLYVHKFAFSSGVLQNPRQINEKEFGTHTLSLAETEAELGAYHLWGHDIAGARPLVEEALKEDAKLALAHEDMGFLDFAEGKDEDAAHEFSQAYGLDGSRYLSLFFRTMLSPKARSDVPSDQASLHSALVKTVELNSQFAPAYVELARLNMHQGKLTEALALSRKAEQLEPSRAGYHLLSGHILLLLGRGSEAATFAKYVADRWYGPDHDEAMELWNAVPASQSPAGDSPAESGMAETKVVSGMVRSTTCGDKDQGLTVVLDHDGEVFTFHGNKWIGGFSDTIWYGQDHFSFCHHVGGLRAVVRYKPSPGGGNVGELTEFELRDDVSAASASPAAIPEQPKPASK